uniref:Uncharacterized protein LOC102800505 n=1 Tax=Saccoglossus kowalevskii TaxID=10224 RepID=A0ABM0MZY1_SACKO|nr:PREDICTED: uncharacterized protein LOC102800505 [Saccoglossus kowalevskii]
MTLKKSHEKQILKKVEWSDDDISLLAKTMAKYPGGTVARWEKIAEEVGRPVNEVSKKAKEIKSSAFAISVQAGTQGITGGVNTLVTSKTGKQIKEDEMTTRFDELQINQQPVTSDLKLKDNEDIGPVQRKHRKVPKRNKSHQKMEEDCKAASKVEVKTWGQDHQKLFEMAIAKFDKNTPERWEKIAAAVPGKTKMILASVDHLKLNRTLQGIIEQYQNKGLCIDMDKESNESSLCDEHGYENMRFAEYCKDCEEPVCYKCMAYTHKDHTICGLEETWNTKQEWGRGTLLGNPFIGAIHETSGIFGNVSISYGKHYWEVSIARSPFCRIGVSYPSLPRDKGLGDNELSWCFEKYMETRNVVHGLRTRALDIPPGNFGLLGVYLDYNAGKLAFFNANTKKHLYTFHDKFIQTLCPTFEVNKGEVTLSTGLEIPEFVAKNMKLIASS